MFSDHNGVKPGINERKTGRKIPKYLEIKISKYPVGQRRSLMINYKIFWTKWRFKYDISSFRDVKAVLKGKCISLNAYIWNEERYETKYLSFHLRQLDKGE